MTGRRAVLSAAIVFAAALVVRVVGIGDRSLWLDEADTLRTVTAPDLAALLDRVREVEIGKTPLYPLLLRAWTAVFGTSEAALRWPSALAGAAAAVGAFLWASALLENGGSRTALARHGPLLAGVVVALHPELIGLSREARSYSFSHAFAFLAGAASVPAYLAPAGPRTRLARVAAPLLAALAASFHLFTGFLSVGIFVGVAAILRARRASLRPVIVGVAALLVLLALQAPLVMRHANVQYGAGDLPRAGLRDFGHHARLLLGGSWAAVPVLALLGVAAFRGRREPIVRVALWTGAASVGAALAVHLAGPTILLTPSRYLAWSVGPMALVAATLTSRMRDLPAAAASALLVLALGAGALQGRLREIDYAEDWRGVADAIRADGARADDVVAVHRPFVETPLRVYYTGPAPVLPLEDALLPGRSTGRVWLVWSHAGEFTDAERARLEAAFGPSSVVHSEPAMVVFRFDRRSSTGR